MEGAAGPYNGRTVEEVFKDLKGRRAGMIKALTTDAKEFYQQCDPEKEKLCLFGLASETWEVNLPPEEYPPKLPMPALGINVGRDEMQEEVWLSMVAVHSDAWLLAVAFYFGERFGFEKNDRRRLFNMINELPTIFEVVTGTVKKQTKEKPSVTNHNGNKSKPNAKMQRVSESQRKVPKLQPPHKEEDDTLDDEDEEEHAVTPCGACGENYASDEFWICCDMCEIWFHGKCVKITPERAQHFKQYNCPSCNGNKSKPNAKVQRVSESQTKVPKLQPPHKEEDDTFDEEDEEEHCYILCCGVCGENYACGEFWIRCDMCEKWFHGKCVKIRLAKAQHFKQYKCPSCSSSTKCPSCGSSNKWARA